MLGAIRVGDRSIDWSLLARQAQADPTLAHLYAGEVTEVSEEARAAVPLLIAGLPDIGRWTERAAQEVEQAASAGARLTTVMDDDYPVNLRLIPNLPPFLFYRGRLRLEDSRSVAVIGTRNPSDRGLRLAGKMAAALATHGVTVVSGLARGIDTAAHESTLAAGGRTIAVVGTGITRCYPQENTSLAERIAHSGVVVSQFWPSTSPARWTFPRRNVVTSGISQGSVVIEASSTSGAKMQARLALEHRKRVFLLRSLVADQEWGRRYLTRGAIEVATSSDVLHHLADPHRVAQLAEQRRQLTEPHQAQIQGELLHELEADVVPPEESGAHSYPRPTRPFTTSPSASAATPAPSPPRRHL